MKLSDLTEEEKKAVIVVLQISQEVFDAFERSGHGNRTGLLKCVLRSMLFMMEQDDDVIFNPTPVLSAAIMELIVNDFREEKAKRDDRKSQG